MRLPLLTSAVVLGLALSAPAFAYSYGEPMAPVPGGISPQAYNLPPSDYAPARPMPWIGHGAGMHRFLRIARHAVHDGNIRVAQDALVRAISARSHADERAGFPPGQDHAVLALNSALDALVAHRFGEVDRLIADVQTAPPVGYGMGYGYHGYNHYGMNQ